ncbi:MAG: osmoprotectant NAGGN system M42 family peptidase [Rhodospirillaceae bacterium]|nr:osmoprotectant NAGGN system M42 family peptidase [Rhodospirillaceae bacterium]
MSKPAIDNKYLKKTLESLLSIPSPSGMTEAAVNMVCGELDDMGIPYALTNRGAIKAFIAGKKGAPHRALAVHLDTLGAMVKRLKPNGRLGLVAVGTWSSRFAEGARVLIHSDNGKKYRGTVLPLKASGHTYHKEIDSQPTTWENLEIRVDEACKNADDLWKIGIRVGDFISVDTNFEISDSGYINSRHLDDKAGVASVLTALRALKKAKATPSMNCHILFTTTEEIGTGGAHIIDPEVKELVSIDNGTMAPEQNTCEFGVTIAMQDLGGPFDRPLSMHLIDICRRENLEFSRDVFNYYLSDGAGAQKAGHDLRVALMCFGLDASHGYERVHIKSLQTVAGLVLGYLLSEQLSVPAKGNAKKSKTDTEQQTQK